jgi:hypothetical protein
MWIQDKFDLIILAVACEALVGLWFHAAPLQPLRGLIIRLTPILYSRAQSTHLLDCKYCCSVWAAGILTALFFLISESVFAAVITVLFIHRISNFLHLSFSYLRDKQFDLRVKRDG